MRNCLSYFFSNVNGCTDNVLIIYRIDGNRGYPGLDAEVGPKGQKGSPGIIGLAGRPVI